jgi:HD-GYP domain-containing protein (c-di-GMP phosphodiesterase class II)
MTNTARRRTRNPVLLISSHIEREPAFEHLCECDFSFLRFQEDVKKWDDPGDSPAVYLLDESFLLHDFSGLLDLFFQAPTNRPVIVLGREVNGDYLAEIFPDRLFAYLPKPIDPEDLLDAIRKCITESERKRLVGEYEKRLAAAQQEIADLREIGLALSSERDPAKLLELILTRSRHLVGADAASLYLLVAENKLRFSLTQNSSLDWQLQENSLILIDEKSIAGYVAQSGNSLNLLDVYLISPRYPFTFNPTFDETSGYRCKSMVVVPIKNLSGQVLGVIQIINKRSDFESHRRGVKLRAEVVIPFSRNDQELLESLASQAAVAMENSRLLEEIRGLFEGFVKASVTAIEARDPTTCGHSERVAALTVAFAQKINDMGEGLFADVRFTDSTLTEIRYASLLHDFGKVGVREEVLTKARKLFPHELDGLKLRYQYLRKAIEADFFRDCYEKLWDIGKEAFAVIRPGLEAQFQTQLDELEDTLFFLVQSNEPSILEEGNFHRLLDISQRRYTCRDGRSIGFLSDREAHVLAIRKGSLSEQERTEIESHVTHTFNFLSKIPWTRNLSRIPEIAFAHHEKLNGRGYPNHLEADQIPLESRLMTISDIYDALTAKDRPYKRAISSERAFDIMYHEVTNGLLSRSLLDVFVEAGIYKVIDTGI